MYVHIRVEYISVSIIDSVHCLPQAVDAGVSEIAHFVRSILKLLHIAYFARAKGMSCPCIIPHIPE
jgi:hypothetical protein